MTHVAIIIKARQVSYQDYLKENKARYTATLVASGWAGPVMEKVTWAFGQEQ